MAFTNFAPTNMTTNSLPTPYVASASSYYAHHPYKAFDGDPATYWEADNAWQYGWLKIDFGSGNSWNALQYDIQARNPAFGSAPKDWTFEGSNDNSNWDILDTVTGESAFSNGEIRTYTCDTTGTHYR